MKKGTTPDELVGETARRLERIEEMKPPEWVKFVKTGVCKERVPDQKNWWYIRSASVLIKLSGDRSLGVPRLRKIYGSRKRRGHKPEHKYPASGSVMRKILQHLEKAGFLSSEKGRVRTITEKGKTFLNDIAKSAEKRS